MFRCRNECKWIKVYHKLGNIGFLAFSGAALFTDMLPHFQEARGDCFKSGPLLADVLEARMDSNVATALNLGPPLR